MNRFLEKNIQFFRRSDEEFSLTDKTDNLACEVPISLVYNGIAHTVMMATPQNLADFALGFSLTEGIIEQPQEIYGIDVVEVCNGIEVQI